MPDIAETMALFARSPVTAVLGPTNTGKTHLAVERMCGHSSGMMGFPLRLLAREVYDRVVGMKGPAQVALITGEEKNVPPGARYFLCTAESMRSEEHTSELQSLMRTSYAVFCLKKKQPRATKNKHQH